MENLNNTFSNHEVPQEIKKWNWGAFMLNIFWGIGNRAYLTLLCFVPLLNVVWVFVCGAKGNEWAWKNGNYSSAEEFLSVQSTWNRAGLAAFIFACIIILLEIILFSTMISILGSLRY